MHARQGRGRDEVAREPIDGCRINAAAPTPRERTRPDQRADRLRMNAEAPCRRFHAEPPSSQATPLGGRHRHLVQPGGTDVPRDRQAASQRELARLRERDLSSPRACADEPSHVCPKRIIKLGND